LRIYTLNSYSDGNIFMEIRQGTYEEKDITMRRNTTKAESL